jgi:ABC-2 type transport system ATP-binding protein
MSLVIEGLYKKYSSIFSKTDYIINDLSFNIEDGQIYSIIGQNGVGKTTTIKCILKLINYKKGKIYYKNSSIETLLEKSMVGYMPENLFFPTNISLEEFLFDLCVLRGVAKKDIKEIIDKLISRFGLGGMQSRNISKFSKGMKRKVAFIQAIISKPKLLILDEPTDGLDPISRRDVLQYIREYADTGNMVLITSHILSDLNLISDKVGLMHDGKLVSEINIKNYNIKNYGKIVFETKRDNIVQNEIYDLAPMTQINVKNIDRCIIKDFMIDRFDLEEWYFKELKNKGVGE